MSTAKHILLREFIATVPICVQTTPLAAVLEMFSQKQCDRLVVLNQQQFPIGVVQLRHLMSQLMQSFKSGINDCMQQPLYEAVHQVEPVKILPADVIDLREFKLYLRSQQEQANTDCEWGLIDSEGKFLGLLDTRIWKFLTLSSVVATEGSKSDLGHSLNHVRSIEPYQLDLLVQMLERLPLPLMLQTGIGEAITQNPAWCQQFGTLSDPEAVRREVETILNFVSPPAEGSGGELQHDFGVEDTHPSQRSGVFPPCDRGMSNAAGELVAQTDLSKLLEIQSPQERSAGQSNYTMRSEELATSASDSFSSGSHCQLGNQPGTCICVWPGQNGGDRVWQFLKIPLLMSEVSNQSQDEQIWLLLATDVTEQQQMASELAAKNADLIQLNRLKDEFLSCISHELRTPLTAMLGLSTLLKDQTFGQLNERQARYARLIHENGRHLMTVVNDILDLTRVETGQLELTLEQVQIRKVCDRAIEGARVAIQPKTNPDNNHTDHHFTLTIEPGLESMVADELRLRQMLFHLLANAFKFTELGGEIGLRVSYWAGWIAFTVWDTGIGIPEHQQHLIFQKFQQLENPLTRQFEGTGLGLVLTRTLARLHGGDVSFLSQEGKGSQFTLLLPPSPPKTGFTTGEIKKRESGDKASPNQPSPSKQLILVVEAAPRFIEDLANQLTSLGYWVVIARSGTEALEKARRLQPGTIFLNPLLPLLSGWDVLTLLKSDPTTSQIPVIVTTTRAEKDHAFANRADEFLSLPVEQQVLQQVLKRFCEPHSLSCSIRGIARRASNNNQLTILRIITPQTLHLSHVLSQANTDVSSSVGGTLGAWQGEVYPSHLNYRVLEADDLEQAALLARIWQPDVLLLDGEIVEPIAYLQQLRRYSSLAGLPIVTLDVATTQAANQVEGLSVFPCLTKTSQPPIHALLSVLQMAAGISCEYSVLVVDAPLVDLPDLSHTLRSEWFQALIQYLHTAGLRGLMVHSWEEVQQQIQKQSVDLVLICLWESKFAQSVLIALNELRQQHNLPPVLVMQRRFSQSEVREQYPHYLEGDGLDLPTSSSGTDGLLSYSCIQTDDAVNPALTLESDSSDSVESILGAIATNILPSSLSMEELLDNIHQTLLASPIRVHKGEDKA